MQPGTVVGGRFEVIAPVGRGGMGAVYRAADRALGGEVALKVLHGADERDLALFSREARLLAEIRHPGIVAYVDHGSGAAGEPYLAMEWLDGEDLRTRLRRRGLSLSESLALAARVADALGALHARGVVHRDVKPQNLLLVGGEPARVKLLDFGVARGRGSALWATGRGVVLGTVGYMAPEQARAKGEVDARADVFSLGCVLFECLTGRTPQGGDDATAVLAKLLLQPAPRLSEVRPELPDSLDALLARMLSREPAERPVDGAAVAHEIASLPPAEDATRLSGSPRALTEGERRLLSVVLARPLAASADGPADVESAVRPYAARIERLADGAIALSLGGRSTPVDQAAQAARAALALRDALPDWSIALATGRGEVGAGATPSEVIDRAAALLEAAAAAGAPCLRVDDSTAGLIDVRFDVADRGVGLELLGEREAADTTRRLLGRPSPFVGREREIASLEAFWDECTAEPIARSVVVTAPPGAGKSRLLVELLRRLRAHERPPEVWIARGDPSSAGAPFGLVAEIVRRASGMRAGDPVSVRRRRLATRLARHLAGDELARVTDFFGELVGAPSDAPGNVELEAARRDARLLGDQLRRAWQDFVDAEAAAHPLLIVLEDLHWGDGPTVRFVDGILESSAERPLFVLALARPEVHERFPRLWGERGVQEIRLGPLTRRAGRALVRAALGDSTPSETVERIVDGAAGNAFAIEELVRAEAEGRRETPATVLAMAQARIEALGPEARRLLRAGSVFGESFWTGGVEALMGDEPIGDFLAEVVDRELVVRRGEGRFPGEEEYAFRHGLLREAAYEMLTEEDRALGHRLAGEWLERAGERDAAALAAHFEHGGEPGRAVGWYLSAAEQAFGGDDVHVALAWAERALRCGAKGEVAGALHGLESEAYAWLGRHQEARRASEAAMALLARGSAAWCSAAGSLALASGKLGDASGVVAVARALLEAWDERADSSAAVVAGARTVASALYVGETDIADALLSRIEADVARLEGDHAALARIAAVRGERALVSGDREAHLGAMQRAGAHFEAAGDRRSACHTRVNVAYAELELGAAASAAATLGSAVETARRLGLHQVTALAKNNLGLALARLGDLRAARTVETEAVEAARAQGHRRLEAASRIYLSGILAASGDVPGAIREARAAADLEGTSPSIRAFALGALARGLVRSGRAAEAVEVSGEALAILDSRGGATEGDAVVRLARAEALVASGREDEARKTLADASRRLHERALRIVDPRLREGFLTQIPEHARTLDLSRTWPE